MMVLRRLFSVLLILTVIPKVAIGSEDAIELTKERLRFEDRFTEKQINRTGLLIKDQKVTDYIDSVMQRLFPHDHEKMQVLIMNTSDIFAFVLATGSIYVSTGLMGRLHNEAQFAIVLAHEGSHYLEDHVYKSRENLKHVASGANFFGKKASLLFYGDYSQNIERSADSFGFKRFVIAGYQANEAAKFFEILLKHSNPKLRNRSIYQSHPKLIDRIGFFRDMGQKTKNLSGSYLGSEKYQSNTRSIFIRFLQSAIAHYEYQDIINVAEQRASSPRFAPLARFYLAEAYRLKGQESDLQLAIDHYKQVIEQRPDHHPAYLSMAIACFKSSKKVMAKRHLEKFMQLAPADSNLEHAQYLYEKVK